MFLDRDGVLNEAIVVDGKPFPPRRIDELVIPDDAVEGCRRLKAAGFKLICVTNQPDVARGIMTGSALEDINRAVVAALGLDDLRVCPHSDADACGCRKPKPGLLLAAAVDHDLDIASSYMVGDRWRDIEAGIAAGCPSIYIDRGYHERRPSSMAHTCDCLAEAARFIMSDFKRPARRGAGETRR